MAVGVDLKVVVLVGGVGGAKLAHGLAQILQPEQLTVIVNTGDDLWYHGLRVCPDLDTVMYTLAGLVDKTFGWGLAGDTRHTLEALQRYGVDAWFGVGDQDLATHLLRTEWWHKGVPLTEITQRLTQALGIGCRVLPMCDAPVATKVQTIEHGELDFQTYFVKLRWQPTVTALRLDGIEAATISLEARAAIDTADVILFGPSNPWLSIAPILAVPGMKNALMAREIPRVAVTPIVEGNALKGPASKIMKELEYEVSAAAVARYYGDVVNGFVYDERDATLEIDTPHTMMMDTIMQTENDRAVLARQVLDWIVEWKNHVRLGNNSG
ncbi:MAG: 2-phospho-L-lactate transferase [Anaerolineae bacterium]|nr:2-phospho-L-lactate transferase [Anaerolineae bacterium]